MNKNSRIIYIVILCLIIILNIFGIFRWHTLPLEDDFKYKEDRWTRQSWAEFYPPNASSFGIDIPMIHRDKFSGPNDVQPYLETHALSGELVNKWILRTKMTDLYIGLNALLLLSLIVAFLYSRNNAIDRRKQ